jgi:radical SAM superfamily enzyme YgiQ (UPF0313 family)
MKITFIEVRDVSTLSTKHELEWWFYYGMAHRIEGMNFYPKNFDLKEYLSKFLFRTGGWIQALSPHLKDFDQEVVWYTGIENLEEILDNDQRLILLSITETAGYLAAEKFVHECRRYFPQHPIWIGGLYASTCPEIVAKELMPDLLFVGEADSNIHDLVLAHTEGRAVPDRITVNHCEQKDLLQDWKLSFRYSAPLNHRVPLVLTCRDCVFDCAFCSIIKKGAMREYSLAELESTFEQLLEQPEDIKIVFESPLPLASEKWIGHLTELLGKRDVTWYCDSRVLAPTFKTQRMFDKLYSAGCRDIYFGTETFDQSLHDRMGKGIQIEHIVPLAKQARNAGLHVQTGWIVGFPGQTVESARQDMELIVENLNKDVFSTADYTYLTVFPGTRLYNDPEKFDIELVNWNLINVSQRPVHRTSQLSAEQIWDLYLEGLQTVGRAQGF